MAGKMVHPSFGPQLAHQTINPREASAAFFPGFVLLFCFFISVLPLRPGQELSFVIVLAATI